MKDYVNHIRESKTVGSGSLIHLPGDSKHEAMRTSMLYGVKVAKKI
jgi:LDH2 family malate/lactate/ureidoglycolate dehydrogenase